MAAISTVSFAKAACRFEGFGSNSFCDSWQWKLDPYRCLDKSQDFYELIFRNGSLDSEALDSSKKVYEVQDGFFLRQVFRLSKSFDNGFPAYFPCLVLPSYSTND